MNLAGSPSLASPRHDHDTSYSIVVAGSSCAGYPRLEDSAMDEP